MDDGAFRRTCSMSYAQTEPVEERGTGWSRRLLQSKWEACTCPFSARSRCSCIAAACRRRFASSTSHGSGNGSSAPDEAPTRILCSPLPNPQARKSSSALSVGLGCLTAGGAESVRGHTWGAFCQRFQRCRCHFRSATHGLRLLSCAEQAGCSLLGLPCADFLLFGSRRQRRARARGGRQACQQTIQRASMRACLMR